MRFTLLKVKELHTKLASVLSNLEKAVSLASTVIDGKMDVKKYELEDKVLSEERKKFTTSIREILCDL